MTQPSSSVSCCSVVEDNHDEKNVLRAGLVCMGCRCGWLCCECLVCCMTCKELKRYCFCRWDMSPTKTPCMFCDLLTKSCTCRQRYRCKWCQVSLLQCKRGGCIQLLPNRATPEAAPFVEIFNKEEKDMYEDEDVLKNAGSDGDSDNVSIKSFNTVSSSSLRMECGSRASTDFSVCSAAQDDWWESQRNEEENVSEAETGSLISSSSLSSC